MIIILLLLLLLLFHGGNCDSLLGFTFLWQHNFNFCWDLLQLLLHLSRDLPLHLSDVLGLSRDPISFGRVRDGGLLDFLLLC